MRVNGTHHPPTLPRSHPVEHVPAPRPVVRLTWRDHLGGILGAALLALAVYGMARTLGMLR